MKRFISSLIIAFFVLCTTLSAHAQSVKTITLKDGSVIRAEITSLTEGIYTLESSTLGAMKIPEDEVQTISDEAPSAANEEFRNQVDQLQENVLSDEAITTEIESLTENEEIMELLSDENLVNDILSYDPTRIQNNEKAQQLMQNPQMQKLMNSISEKIAIPQGQE